MKKLKPLLLLISFLLLLCTISSTALTITPASAQETEATESGSLDNIKKIIKENIENNKVKGAIDNLLNRKMALIGEVNRVTGEAITITNRLGTRIIPLTDDLVIEKDTEPIAVSDIAVEDWTTILGRMEDDEFTPQYIAVQSETLRPKTQYVAIATITEIDRNALTVFPRSESQEREIDIVSGTTYQDLSGEEISLSDLEIDITVLITGYETDDGIEAATIRSLADLATTE